MCRDYTVRFHFESHYIAWMKAKIWRETLRLLLLPRMSKSNNDQPLFLSKSGSCRFHACQACGNGASIVEAGHYNWFRFGTIASIERIGGRLLRVFETRPPQFRGYRTVKRYFSTLSEQIRNDGPINADKRPRGACTRICTFANMIAQFVIRGGHRSHGAPFTIAHQFRQRFNGEVFRGITGKYKTFKIYHG